MGEKFDARNARKTARLRQVAQMYERFMRDGSSTPALDVARELEVKPSTARGIIFRARAEGLLGEAAKPAKQPHRPLRVSWGPDSWSACVTCRVEWPCLEARTPAQLGRGQSPGALSSDGVASSPEYGIGGS